MGHTDDGAVSLRLFEDFLAPLVLGGEVRPTRPIGPGAALDMDGAVVEDRVLSSRVQVARTRLARKLVPIDSLPPPTAEEWALGAALHDLLQSAHPKLGTALRRHAPARLLELTHATLARVRAPGSAGEALARHTWFARLLEMQRIDTTVSWWVGSSTFRGEDPPARLVSWPGIRRVRVDRVPRTILDLPVAGAGVDPAAFAGALARFLARTPLTDLATCHRPAPAFLWGEETLGLVATHAGCTMATRACARAPKSLVDASLGRATRALVAARRWDAAPYAFAVLLERALAEAGMARTNADRVPLANDPVDDADYARCAGAVVACARLHAQPDAFAPLERERLLGRLLPFARSKTARQLEVELSGYFLATAANAAGSGAGSSVSMDP